MARKKKAPFEFQSNLDKIVPKIQEVPQKVMGTIGKNLVKEIKATTMKTQFHQRKAILTKTLQWAYDYQNGKKNTTGIQIGFKMSIPGIVGNMITGSEADPIKPVVIKNAQLIQEMVKIALDEIGKKE